MENDLDIKDIMGNFCSKFTPEYLKDLAKQCYDDDRNYPENFSNWFPHIKNFGTFNHAEIISNQIFSLDEVNLMEKEDRKENVNWEDWYKMLQLTLEKMEPRKLYSIKNGSFSDKFHFNTAITNKIDLPKKLWDLNYDSHLFETGGHTELVVRELIPYNPTNTVTIYEGMPLREEVRVFYNMDNKEIEYMVDYWDYDYCADNMHNKTDRVVFDWFHKESNHKVKLDMVMDTIRNNINTLKFDSYLKGIWSIDFMYVEETAEIYLIDMARGFRSAYWDKTKCTKSDN